MGHTIRSKIKIIEYSARLSVVSKVGGYENVKMSMVSHINQTDCIDHDLATIATARGTVRLAHRRLFRGAAAASEAGVAGRGLLPAALRLQALLQHLRRQGLGEALRGLQVRPVSKNVSFNIWTCTLALHVYRVSHQVWRNLQLT